MTNAKGSVLLDWVAALPWKQQSIILSSLHGPDNIRHPELKKVSRWLRRITQHNADPSTEYMQAETMPDPKAVVKELEFTSAHFVGHLGLALAIIGGKHPDQITAKQARTYYETIVRDITFAAPLSYDEMNDRFHDAV